MTALATILLAALPLGDHAFETDAERVPSFRTGGSFGLANVTIHSAVEPAHVGSVLVLDGKIVAIVDGESAAGLGVDAVGLEGEDFTVIDGTGMHLAPGVVDCHSHMAIDRGINEGTLSITCDVDISDSVNAEDLTIWRALAGGATTARLLHGSANAIGGRHEVIKLKWGRTADELRFEGAPEGVKFALGENPKRSNGGRRGGRFPGTRMGVEAVFDRAFRAAADYRAAQDRHAQQVAAGEDPLPPRRDIRLEALAGILDGSVEVHSHCYRADEILMLLRAAERYGFRIATLQHVLEGYKVAAEMAAHGAGGSTFGDWWAYKIEAYDAIPHNAALMDEAGVLSSLNSDSNEMVRRMYGEAAKSVRYGGMDPVRALALVTLFPAQQLGIGERTGSIEVGKDADMVLLDGDPLSSLAVVRMTFVDGELEFERRDAFGLESEPPPIASVADVDAAEAERDLAADLYQPDGGECTAIVGATLHPITADPIENATIVWQAGRIVRMGVDVPLPVGTLVMDGSGRHVWPGMVALGTALGLFEIGSVPATMDTRPAGGNQPDLRVAASINADTAHIPVTRANGITRAETCPEGGGPLRGQSAAIRLLGETWEELVIDDAALLHLSYPSVSNTADDRKEGDAAERLRDLLRDARDYARLDAEVEEHGTEPPAFDPRLEALAPYALGHGRIALHASNAQTILYAIRFAQDEGLDVALYGAREGWKVADAVAAAGFPVVVGPVLALPSSRFDPYDSAYANAALLRRAGCEVSIMAADRSNQRNLPFHAAMAAAFGLPREEALRAITWYPARVLGISDEVGSLRPGKVADLVVTDGDLLEITTRVEQVVVDGRPASLATRQTDLYDRYRDRLLRMTAR